MKKLIQHQKVNGNEKSRQMKAAYIAYRTIQAVVLIYSAYEIYLNITTGREKSNLLFCFLLLTIPAWIYHMIASRNACKSNKEELKKYDKMIVRGVVLGVGIVLFLVVATVLYAVNRSS